MMLAFTRNYLRKLHVYLLLYADHMILVSKDYVEIYELKKQLSNEFEMKDLGELKRILGKDVEKEGRNVC